MIHLAGEPILGKRWNSKFKKQLYDSRVTNTRKLIALLESHCKSFPKVFITASAVGFYGDRGNEVIDESSASGKTFLVNLCKDWEKALFDQQMKHTRRIALRIGIVLGKGGGALEQMLDPFSLGLGGPLGGGSQWMSWIHLDDLVAIILESLHSNKLSGPINCSSPNPVTNREFTTRLVKTLKTVGFIPIPNLALKVALGETSSVLFEPKNQALQTYRSQLFISIPNTRFRVKFYSWR